MTRILSIISAVAVLGAAAKAQCLQPASGTSVVPGLDSWSETSSYSYAGPIDDEGITNPPIPLTAFPSFPMAGAIGNLDTLWVSANGHVWLTDSSLALTEPVDGGLFGLDSLDEMRGIDPGASARISVLGDDQEAAVVAGAAWDITVDQSVAGQVRVTWTDITRYANTSEKYSISCTLFATGAVQMDYGTIPFPTDTRYVGISIGNGVGSSASPEYDLSTGGDSGTEGLYYQAFGAGDPFDLNGMSILITPNGIGGYTSVVLCSPARHDAYGVGCHTLTVDDSLMQLFADVPSAKAALDGNAILYNRSGNGYVANWLPGAAGALYVPPSGGALVVANADDTTSNITPSAAIPIPGGAAATWTISSNGVLTGAATGNHGSAWTPTLGEPATATGAAWYVWADHNPAESGSGSVKWEEVAGVLYVTFDGVEFRGGTPTIAPSTFQFQVDMATGSVTIVFQSMSVSDSTLDVLVGNTLAGPGLVTVSQDLATVTPYVLTPGLTPVTLSASPAPVINPSTNVTYTIGNLPEYVPGSGVYLSTLFLSVNPIPGGFDLAGILTTVPGCKAYIATLDVNIGTAVTLAPTSDVLLTFSTPTFAPGNVIAAQAVALFDGSIPLTNGESGGFLVSNGVLSTTQPF